MAECHLKKIDLRQNTVRREHGKIYFSSATERKVFFVLTLVMLFLGVLVKFGVI